MAYGTTERLPTILTFKQAEDKFNSIKPIRGSVGEVRTVAREKKVLTNGIRPLAHRRDTHLRIDKLEHNDLMDTPSTIGYQLLCHDSPVITLTQEPTTNQPATAALTPATIITIKPHYISSYTCDFIRNLLWYSRNRPNIRMTQDKMLFEFPERGGQPAEKYLVGPDEELRLRFVEDGKALLVPMRESMEHYTFKPNRKKLKAIHAQYAEFADYYKGVVSLLTQDVDVAEHLEDDPFIAKKSVVLQIETLVNVFGTKEPVAKPLFNPPVHTQYLNTDPWDQLFAKPTWVPLAKHNPNDWATKWLALKDEFLTLVRSDQPEETKFDNFHKAAFALLLADTCGGRRYIPVNHPSLDTSRTSAEAAFREFLLYAYAEEVIEKVPTTPGKVPSTNYAKYIFGRGR